MVVRTPAGNEKKIALSAIYRISLDNDPTFTAAEEAYLAGKSADAVEGYLRAIRSADTWKTQYAAPRLISAAAKANRFDAAVTAYVALARVDAAGAARHKPTLPVKGSAFLEDASKSLNDALRSAQPVPMKQAILSLLLDVEMARGDAAAAERAVGQLLALVGDGGNVDPKLAGMVGDIRLGQARLAVQNRQFDAARAMIESAGPSLTEPRQQAEALFIQAQAKEGVAKADDAVAQLDVSLAYMRVVAHFGPAEGRPFVAASLLRAGASLERAGRAADARLLYDQLSAEFPDSAEATEAAARSARLNQRP